MNCLPQAWVAHLSFLQGAILGSSLKGCPLNSRGCNPRKSVPRVDLTLQGSHYGTGKELNPWRGSDPAVTLPWVAPTAIHVQTLRVWISDGCRGCKKLRCAPSLARTRPQQTTNRTGPPEKRLSTGALQNLAEPRRAITRAPAFWTVSPTVAVGAHSSIDSSPSNL